MLDLSSLDIESYLDSQGIDYLTAGKNIGPGCVGVCCPFCGDSTYHLDIFRDHKNWSCWRCSAKGGFYDLMKALVPGFKWDTVKAAVTANDFQYASVVDAVKAKFQPKPAFAYTPTYTSKVVLPTEQLAGDVAWHLDYEALLRFVINRSIPRRVLFSASCRYTNVGPYSHRLIIPIDANQKLVSFQARDVTGQAAEKYRTAPGTKVNDYLYYYQRACGMLPRFLVITEGVFDVWQGCYNSSVFDPMIYSFVASFGTHITDKQRELILQIPRHPANNSELKVIFCWDGDAYSRAFAEALKLRPFVDAVFVARVPPAEDPASMAPRELLYCLQAATCL